MIVVDHAPSSWYLLRDGDRLLLDVNCSHGAVGYGWVMALTADETARYRAEGRAAIDRLAAHVQDSAPGVPGSTSPYVGRDLGHDLDGPIALAVSDWRRVHGRKR